MPKPSLEMADKYFIYKRDDFGIDNFGADFHCIADKKYNNDNIEDEDDEYSEFLQDLPHSSSSLDRSSIGSIPWADDAIKQNQLEWERVERMLSGQEELTAEPELRNEILDWQKKFPQLLSGFAKVTTTSLQNPQAQSCESLTFKADNSLDIDSLANLKLDSLSDDGRNCDDDLVTPTNLDRQRQRIESIQDLPTKRHISVKTMGLAALKLHKQRTSVNDPVRDIERDDLRINSVPLSLHKRNLNQSKNDQPVPTLSFESNNKTDFNSMAFLPQTPPLYNELHSSYKNSTGKLVNTSSSPTVVNTNYAVKTNANIRMPPILNVLESKRRFRGLTNNRSFVQLEQVQQAKSAAVISQQRSSGYGNSATATRFRQSTTWQLPLAAANISGRFLNNRNSIILPAIKLQHVTKVPTLTSSGGEIINGSSNLSRTSGKNVTNQQYNSNYRAPQHGYYQPCRTRMSTTTTTTPSTAGRSISAAVHPQTRYEFNAFYLPYSASKFKVLK